MKKYKITFILLILCIMFSIVTTYAADVLLVMAIEIPAYKGNYTLDSYRTKTESFKSQYYKSAYTQKITASSDEVDIQVRTKKSTGVTSSWQTLSKEETATFSESNSIISGSYTLQFQQPTVTMYKVRHTGQWTYNP